MYKSYSLYSLGSVENSRVCCGNRFSCSYKLLPATDKKIDVTSVTSSDDNIIEILEHNEDERKITALAKNKGFATITVNTKSFYSSTTIFIKIL